jgi:hypothetical protein
MDIVALFRCLRPSLPSTTWRQLSRMALALLVMIADFRGAKFCNNLG